MKISYFLIIVSLTIINFSCSKHHEELNKKSKPVLDEKNISKEKKVKDQFITEIIAYDSFGQPVFRSLKNIKGELIAKNVFKYIDGNIVSMETIDIKSNKIIHTTNYNSNGDPLNPMYLCLDEEGNIITKWFQPVMVNTFEAEQMGTGKYEYNNSDMTKTITKLYPCKNCASQTGIKNVVYVW
ncbi:hypothetical protein HY745_12480 [Candidatus Desantisbacteria bacterium]|nr:hypothetical protein [Candidatus Desantisbacteria bacterium]